VNISNGDENDSCDSTNDARPDKLARDGVCETMKNAVSVVVLMASLGCLPTYDPPPDLLQINIDKGLYDPSEGPLELIFTEPVKLKSVEITLYLGRTDEDFRLCLPDADGKLAKGCSEEAAIIIGPCRADPARARIDNTSADQLVFECNGGEMTLDGTNRRLSVLPQTSLAPFESYRLEVSAGLEDEAGRTRKVPVSTSFQVKSNIPCEPTDFESGFFFSTFNIEAPARGQFHFLFWVQVDSQTGQTRLYGSRLRPKDDIDPATNRNFADWYIDADPKTGSDILATGQTAKIGTEEVFAVYPFTLNVNQPRIIAPGVELSGQVSFSIVGGASTDERDLISGRLSGPTILLGEGADQADLGAGYGTAIMFRLLSSEAPSFEEGIPRSVSVAEIQAPFDACTD
jgi:hypothetical protein